MNRRRVSTMLICACFGIICGIVWSVPTTADFHATRKGSVSVTTKNYWPTPSVESLQTEPNEIDQPTSQPTPSNPVPTPTPGTSPEPEPELEPEPEVQPEPEVTAPAAPEPQQETQPEPSEQPTPTVAVPDSEGEQQ